MKNKIKKVIAVGSFIVVAFISSPGFCWGGGYKPTCGPGGEYTLHDGCVPVRPVAPTYRLRRSNYGYAPYYTNGIATSTPGYVYNSPRYHHRHYNMRPYYNHFSIGFSTDYGDYGQNHIEFYNSRNYWDQCLVT